MSPSIEGSAPERERLEGALVELAADAVPRPDCPEPERLWETARGEGEVAGRREIVDHMATCEACSEAWRLAMELSSEERAAEERTTTAMATTASWYRWRPLALAAMVVLAVGAAFVVRNNLSPPPIERGDLETIEALTGAGPLPRKGLSLAWTPGPEGTLYDVLVTTAELELVTEARALAVAELALDEADLAALAPGAELLWKVEALAPDGSRRSSPTFITRLE